MINKWKLYKIPEDWLYICTAIDVCNNEIITNTISDYRDKYIALDTLEKSIIRKDVSKLIFIIWSCIIYKNKEFIEFCKKNKIIQSMSNVGEPTESYPCEFYFSIL